MPKSQQSDSGAECELCGKRFASQRGLSTHQRSCRKKAVERENDAAFEQSLEDSEARQGQPIMKPEF